MKKLKYYINLFENDEKTNPNVCYQRKQRVKELKDLRSVLKDMSNKNDELFFCSHLFKIPKVVLNKFIDDVLKK